MAGWDLHPLENAAFARRTPGDSRFAVTPEQWQWLIAGVDWQRLAAVPPAGARL